MVSVYKMDHWNRGYALIINNYEFKPNHRNLQYRAGAEHDHLLLKKILEKYSFKVETNYNQTANQMIDLLKKYAAADFDHTHNDCFFCMFMSHGDENGIFDSDSEYLNLTNVDDSGASQITASLEDICLKLFNNSTCKSLQNKPKLFFIGSCRGKESTECARVCPTTINGIAESNSSTDNVVQLIPLSADFMFHYATQNKTVSYRWTGANDGERGDWYFRILASEL